MKDKDVESKEYQIFKSAEHEFLTKGFDGARTTSIAKSAGVTHAMLHYYFRTKEQLFEYFVEKKMSEITPMLAYLFGNDQLPLTERIREAVSVHFDFIASNPDLPRFLINEVLPNQERLEMLRTKAEPFFQLFEDLQSEVDQAAACGEVEHFRVLYLFQSILALNIMSPMMTVFAQNMMAGENISIDELLERRKMENVEMIMRRITKKV